MDLVNKAPLTELTWEGSAAGQKLPEDLPKSPPRSTPKKFFWVGPISILTIRLFPTLSHIVYYLPWAPPNAAYTLTELAE